MAGKKSSAPTDVYVVVGRAMYDLSQITIQGVYVDQQAAMTAANDDAATVQQVPVNYSGAYVSFIAIATRSYTYMYIATTRPTVTLKARPAPRPNRKLRRPKRQVSPTARPPPRNPPRGKPSLTVKRTHLLA